MASLLRPAKTLQYACGSRMDTAFRSLTILAACGTWPSFLAETWSLHVRTMLLVSGRAIAARSLIRRSSRRVETMAAHCCGSAKNVTCFAAVQASMRAQAFRLHHDLLQYPKAASGLSMN